MKITENYIQKIIKEELIELNGSTLSLLKHLVNFSQSGKMGTQSASQKMERSIMGENVQKR